MRLGIAPGLTDLLGGPVVEVSQPKVDGDLDQEDLSWGGRPSADARTEEVPQRAARTSRSVFESQRPIAAVARDLLLLGVHREALRLWVGQADAGARGDRVTTDERERLKTLERENRELKKANEILKAASVFSPRSSTLPDRGERVHRRAPRRLRGRAHPGCAP